MNKPTRGVSKDGMEMTGRNKSQAWGWAFIINLALFILIWLTIARIPAPAGPSVEPETNGIDTPAVETRPGGAFGQLTHLVGDASTAEGETIPLDSRLPPVGETGHTEGSGFIEVPITDGQQVWVSEFYLDRGPPLSFAPRLNADGTPRPHPATPDRIKAPTYEDQSTNLSPEEYNLPIMSPESFSKLDLPDEYRDLNLSVTLRIQLDARGRISGRPVIIRSSGHRYVDEITITKVMNEASFTPAAHIETGEPSMATLNFTIWWRNPPAS